MRMCSLPPSADPVLSARSPRTRLPRAPPTLVPYAVRLPPSACPHFIERSANPKRATMGSSSALQRSCLTTATAASGGFSTPVPPPSPPRVTLAAHHLQRQRTLPPFVIATAAFVAPMPRALVIVCSIRSHCILAGAPCDRPYSWSPTPAPVVSLKLSAYPLPPSHRVRPSLDARAFAQPHPDCAPLFPFVHRSSRRLPTPSPIATSISVTAGRRNVPLPALLTPTAIRARSSSTQPTRRFWDTTIHRERGQ
ncbi:hypothetical protein K438DRAFT_1989694 [Mycena galopus ATCC 62051]|nr:hypothetical protein K438DRAFT_1989694 [Mycena galopus ATCC 62051]